MGLISFGDIIAIPAPKIEFPARRDRSLPIMAPFETMHRNDYRYWQSFHKVGSRFPVHYN